jgi:hypothetical protein
LLKCSTGQAALVFKISVRDELALRMRRQPTLAVAHKLRDLSVSHPIVFVVIQYGMRT